MIPEYQILQAVRDDLIAFSQPTHFEGFFINFAEWVIREWERRFPYHSEQANAKRRVNICGTSTPFVYRDFMLSQHGYDYHAYSLSIGSTFTQTMENRLYEFFHESMRLRAIAFIGDHYPKIDGDRFWTRVFCDGFGGEEERMFVEDINELFGFYAVAARPFTCPSDPGPDEGLYCEWSLADFKTAAGLIRGLGGERLGKVAKAAGRLFVLHKGQAQGPSSKKPLSQNGVIA